MGNTLDRPTLLLKRSLIGTTNFKTENLAGGGDFENFKAQHNKNPIGQRKQMYDNIVYKNVTASRRRKIKQMS
jgi:hypothetical protein